jgi:site-specific recombinase XerD
VKQLIKNTNKYINHIAPKLGFSDRITSYWARHTYSTILKNSGASIEFISEQLGHSSIKVTSSYLDSFEDQQRDDMAKRLIDFKTVKKTMQKKPSKKTLAL